MKYFLLLFICSQSFGDICTDWFAKSKLISGKGCVEKCTLLPVGLDSFLCPQQCNEFCSEKDLWTETLSRLAYYPGLTRSERDLIKKYPQQAITVFLQKERSESATKRRFGYDGENDESDAFRHFVWAALLSKELGPDRAKEFLDAHESAESISSAERGMDLANNRAGLYAADKLKRENKLTIANIEDAAIQALKEGSLVILKSKKTK